MKERRAHTRLPTSVSAEVLSRGKRLPATTRDLGEGGVGLRTRLPLAEGTTVLVNMFLTLEGIEDIETKPLSVQAQVAWCAETDVRSFESGLRFLTLTEEQIRLLKDLIAQL
ncbi:MAG: PilZ domain-containing protein [Deltaproteobacteria bacterium]|nr:PilZ domain-containing protein [Deltaproteobacteria bacterium]